MYSAMPDAGTPQFRLPNEGDPIPQVDPEDLKRRWNPRKRLLTCVGAREAQSEEADKVAVAHRFRMIRMLAEGFDQGQLLGPWKHGEELDDAVFRVAASFPIQPLRQHVYQVPGDSMWGFDPNGFVEKLIEETGISHTWKPVPARVSKGGFSYAGEEVFKLLSAVWSKCRVGDFAIMSTIMSSSSDAMWFDDFETDIINLAREFSSVLNGGEGRPPLVILSELERRTQWLNLECSICKRLMLNLSDEELVQCRQSPPSGAGL